MVPDFELEFGFLALERHMLIAEVRR